MRIYVPKDIKDYEVLHRYIIAFDGDVLLDADDSDVTHVVVEHSEVRLSLHCSLP